MPGGNRASSGLSPASVQGRDSHRQHVCVCACVCVYAYVDTCEGTEPAQFLTLPLAWAKTTTASTYVCEHTGKGVEAASSGATTLPASTQPLTLVHTLGKKWNQLRSAGPSPQILATPLIKTETAITLGRSPTPSGFMTQPLGPQPHPQ